MLLTSDDVITHADVDFEPGKKSTHVIYFVFKLRVVITSLCARGTKFMPFAFETYGALSHRSDRFLIESARLSSRECA